MRQSNASLSDKKPFFLLSQRNEDRPVDIRNDVYALRNFQQSRFDFHPVLPTPNHYELSFSNSPHKLTDESTVQHRYRDNSGKHTYAPPNQRIVRSVSYESKGPSSTVRGIERSPRSNTTTSFNSPQPVFSASCRSAYSKQGHSVKSCKSSRAAGNSPRAVPAKQLFSTSDLGETISTVERTRLRNDVTKKLMEFMNEVSELNESKENMRKLLKNSMRVDPRYCRERGSIVHVLEAPQSEQTAALTAVLHSLEKLQEDVVELTANYLSPEEKRYLGIDTHQFQTRREKVSTYQYVQASDSERSAAPPEAKPSSTVPKKRSAQTTTVHSERPSTKASVASVHQDDMYSQQTADPLEEPEKPLEVYHPPVFVPPPVAPPVEPPAVVAPPAPPVSTFAIAESDTEEEEASAPEVPQAVEMTDVATPERYEGGRASLSTLGGEPSQTSPTARESPKEAEPPVAPVPTGALKPVKGPPAGTLFKKLPNGEMIKIKPFRKSVPESLNSSVASKKEVQPPKFSKMNVRSEFRKFLIDSDSDTHSFAS